MNNLEATNVLCNTWMVYINKPFRIEDWLIIGSLPQKKTNLATAPSTSQTFLSVNAAAQQQNSQTSNWHELSFGTFTH